MPEPVAISESAIRALATPEVFDRGWKYFEEEAIDAPTRQDGLLQARCYGTGAAVYQVRAEVDENGIGAYDCSCPYTWGGACKHVVALLLCYLHQPGMFTERPKVADLLVPLERSDLVGVLERLVARQPDLLDRVEAAVYQVRPDLRRGSTAGKSREPVSEKVIQRRIQGILNSLDGLSRSQAYWGMSRLVSELQEVRDEALELAASGDAPGALAVLLVLLEDVGAEFETLDDSDGEVGAFLTGLAQPLAQAALQANLPASGRRRLANRVEQAVQLLASCGIDGLLELPRAIKKGKLLVSDENDDNEVI
jgi:hypothetical protein